jgi:putative transposase
MGFAYKFHDPDGTYFVTCATVQWVDVFTRSIYSDIVVQSLQYCIDQKGLVLHAWVIMPNHLHMVISRRGESSLSDIIRDFKKFTSSKIVEAINSPTESRRNWMQWLFKSAGKQNANNTNFQFWQQENHPIELESAKFTRQKIEYIHENPVRAKFVDVAQRYVYSSAKDYAGERGLLPISILEDVYDAM